MIAFACASCGKTFTVADHHAGRRGKCPGCGTLVTVPAAGAVAAAVAGGRAGAAARPDVRTRRLIADARLVAEAFAACPHVRVTPAAGDPPDLYEVEYAIRGLGPPAAPGGEPVPLDRHRAEVRLTSEYPRLPPKCRMLTPAFHPNISPDVICIGDHWAASLRLVDLIAQIGEMIAYQAYNIRSPLDGEAAMWADLNAARLPLDARDLSVPSAPATP